MRSIIISSPGIRQLEPKRGFTDGQGYSIELRFKGTQLECGAALEAFVNAGVVRQSSIDHDEGGMYVLTVVVSAKNATTDPGTTLTPVTGSDSVVTTWSRQSSSQEKLLWYKPEIRSILDLYPTEELKAQFRTKIEQYFRGELSNEEYDTWININFEERGPTATQRTNLKKLLEMFAKGVDSFRVDSFIMQRTQVGAPESLANNDATNNKVWKKETLIAQPTMPGPFKSAVPDGYYVQYAAEITVLDSARWQVTQLWQWVDDYERWISGEPI